MKDHNEESFAKYYLRTMRSSLRRFLVAIINIIIVGTILIILFGDKK